MTNRRQRKFRLFPWVTVLLFGLLLVAGAGDVARAATDCGSEPCPGTLPAIWPHPSATVDGFVRILGWNLDPTTGYDVVLVGPDGISLLSGSVTTDVEGGILGRLDGPDGQPYVCGPPGAGTSGVYQVLLFRAPWSGGADETPVAATSFYNN